MSIDGGRLRMDVEELALIGGEGGAVTRLAYSALEANARDWISRQYSALGLAVRIDGAGNLIARREGAANLPAVMTGSHIDTVPNGGRFDGSAGSLSALVVARTLAERGIQTLHPIEFVVFAAEESPRFRAANRFGSRAMAGAVGTADAESLVDDDGISVAEAMRRIGLDPACIAEARRLPGELAAFVELHIEQETTLASANVPVGIVTAIAGSRRYMIEITGRADHSGGTPMGDRRDALAAAAEIVLAVEAAASEIGGALVATATMLVIRPNAMNVVPGSATLGVDIRDREPRGIEAASRRLQEIICQVSERRGVVITGRRIRDSAPLKLSDRIQMVIETASIRCDLPAVRVVSSTGHDAASLSDLTDVGMIFVRNPSGRSHSPDEVVEWEDLTAAANVLFESITTLAGEPDGDHATFSDSVCRR